MTWQPIETAPKDQAILVWCADSPSDYNGKDVPVWVVTKDDDGDFFIEHDGDGARMDWSNSYPTRWQPLPEPPK
jgi:hypothetical protein